MSPEQVRTPGRFSEKNSDINSQMVVLATQVDKPTIGDIRHQKILNSAAFTF